MPSYDFWARTASGLEALLLEELQNSYGLKEFKSAHKTLLFSLKDPATQTKLPEIRTADDVFKYLGSCAGIDNKKSSSEKFTRHFTQKVIPHLLKRGSADVRITLSFLGQRNFNRYFIENLLGEAVTSETDCRFLANKSADAWKEGEVRIRYHVEGEIAYCGIALRDTPLHRRQWRTAAYPAQLHPPLAAAMARAVKPLKGDTIIDPFCGSGTTLIESALLHPCIPHLGFDTDADAIEAARVNSANAGTTVEFMQEDFLSLFHNFENFILISNPPWGQKHSQGDGEQYFKDKFVQLVLCSKRASLLMPANFVSTLASAGLPLKEVTQTRVKGRLASIVGWGAG